MVHGCAPPTQPTCVSDYCCGIPMTLPPPSYNNNPKSFAFATVRKRWPIIVKDIIKDLDVYTSAHPAAQDCGKYVSGKLTQVLADFENDAAVAQFLAEDIKLKPELRVYNEELAQFNAVAPVTWLTGPWLFLECYLYQLINLVFQQTQKLGLVDAFERLKNLTFQQSSFGVLELCKRYEVLKRQMAVSKPDGATLKLLFHEYIDVSLWGNATDLSLLAGNVTLDDIRSVQGEEVRKKNEEKIIANDTDKAWAHFENSSRHRVDFVLDNSGFELFADLNLALFLLDSGLAKQVVFHCKDIPWFVSDTMPKDFDNLVAQLGDPSFFLDIYNVASDKDAVAFFLANLKTYVADGSIEVKQHKFWTSSANFWSIPAEKDLYQDLLLSNLVIFKGDLNYRKLTGDLEWAKTTPFVTAIQDLASSKLPVLALRTCKADVVVGLPEGLNEKLVAEYASAGNEGIFWTASGKWAVISFSDGL